MADTLVTSIKPTSLAEYESLISDKDLSRKVFMHTIRDYQPFFDQAVIIPGNDGLGDRGQIVTKYPEGELHGYNEGWGSEVVVGQNMRYTCCRRSSSSTIDQDEYNDQPESDRNEWRLRRDKSFAMGFARATVRALFNGDPNKDPNACRGLFQIIQPSDPIFGKRCLNAGGTTAGAQTDILLMGWDPAYNYCFYPEHGDNHGGFEAIVRSDPVRVSRQVDGVPKHYWALETDFRWDIGVAIYEPRTVVRICNVDTSTWSKTGTNLITLLTEALNRLDDEFRGRCCFYANDSVVGALRHQINNKSNVYLTLDDVAGRKVMAWDGVPIHRLGNDVISNTNDPVSFE